MPNYIPFEAIEALADIEKLAEMLNLTLTRGKTQFRGKCPVHGGDDRTLCISPHVRSRKGSLGVFYCQSAQEGGDRISLVAHCMEMRQQEAAFFIQSQFGTVDTGTVSHSTVPTVSKPYANREEPRQEPAKPAFDPEKFAANLVWSEEVKALGLISEDAERLGVGFHPQRKAVYFPIRNPDGTISGFIGCDAKRALRLPPQWLEGGNVVRLKRA